MDSINLSTSGDVVEGLRKMMMACINENEYIQTFVEIEIALLIIEVAKRAEDREVWFPRGKWATIQNIQEKVYEQLDLMERNLISKQSKIG